MDKEPTTSQADLFADTAASLTAAIPQGEARFIVSGNKNIVTVKIQAADVIVRVVAKSFLNDEQPDPKPVMRIDFINETISIYPQLIGFSERLYRQKYTSLKEIEIDLPPDTPHPTNHFEVVELTKLFPSGFIQDPAFGLGVIKEMRPLIGAVESVDKVTRLVIRDGTETRVERGTFYLNGSEYSQLRLGMQRIARRYQAESLTDRQLMAHNASVHKALPDTFPYKERPYKPGTVFKLLGGSHSSVVSLQGQDRVAVLQAVANNAKAIAERDPQEFIQLQKDIEIVSLDTLIDAVKVKINRNSSESTWQTLLELNPFLLSMLFGQPVVLLQSNPSVGGQQLSGHGTKIADFLTTNAISHNAALVEIKRPKTPLLNMKQYRGGVYGPSRELMGSITQVLDQRLKLITNIMTIKGNSRITDLEVAAVECIVVAGVMPKGHEAINSFELIRNSFKDVRILTFDELLERLQLLRKLLDGERHVSTVTDDTERWGDVFEVDEDDGTEDEGPVDEDRDPRD